MEQKNFLVAMGLIVSFLLIWTVFVVPRFTPPPAPPAAAVTDSGLPGTAGFFAGGTPIHPCATMAGGQSF